MNIDRRESGLLLTNLSKIIIAIAGVLIGIIIARIFVGSFSIADDSMQPNFTKGDLVYFLKHATPKNGDIVLITSPIEPDRVLLRRIIAKEGDSVEIKDKIIYVNGNQLNFNWKIITRDKRIFPMSFSFRDNYPIIKLKRKEYFVIGDNLDSSMDSRFFGTVSDDKIIGKIIYKF